MYNEEKVEDFRIRAEDIIKKFNKEDAFKILIVEIDNCEDKYLNEYITVLNFLRYEKVLDWIEGNAARAKNLSENWGHLAASSHFSWNRAEKWLEMGRPWSLIALDALMFCTTVGERLNQSPWMRELNPRLVDTPKLDRMANRLQVYLKTDSVPRTKNTVNHIISNIFGIC